ncbi:MAG TPA: hypothetical protein VLU94_01555, partial [Candidatus Nitrosotalea sp.]|nr:hypothetical protein [Candidatus Nitrosotalea sp.]
MNKRRLGMVLIFLVFLPGALIVASAFGAEKPAPLPEGVSITKYNGWTNSVVLDAADAMVRATVVPATGGRIAQYSINGDNIIYEHPGSEGKTLATAKESFWVGGSQIDLGPEIRGLPEHNTLWLGPYQWTAKRSFTLSLSSEPDTVTGIQLGRDMVINPENGALGINSWMKNVTNQDASLALWDRTMCKPGGYVLVPLNRKSRFPARWRNRTKVDDRFVDEVKDINSPVAKIIDNVLVVKTGSLSTRIGADSDAGWIAYVRGRLLFVKFFRYEPKGNYSDGGCSLAVYFDQSMTEFGPISPETHLKPGETYAFPE